MIKIILIIIAMTLFGALGSFYLKKSADSMTNIFSLLKDKNFYIGIILFCLGAVFNIYGLRFVDYSILFPIKSLAYIWTIIIARIFLNEKLTRYKLAGISLILIGVIVLSI
ncbi:MAG: EamA family transporter [Andreesenia angusta]|nr:EamA family transporter [Andreesenia angusta]